MNRHPLRHLHLGMALLALTLSGCKPDGGDEGVPAYLYVERIDLETTAQEGSNSHKITDIWLTVDNELLGAFPLPAMIPVLKRGTQRLYIEAGIKDNGINATPEVYPFYAPLEVDVDLAPGRIDTIRPVVRYRQGIRFPLLEDFEGPTHGFRDLRTGNDYSRIQIVSTGAFEGNGSGLIRLDTANAVVELATNDSYENLNANGLFVYLEMDYRADIPVVFGLLGSNGTTEEVVYDPGFAPREQWNKIYFNLTGLVLEGGFQRYRVGLITGLPTEGGQFTRNEARIWLDNIKLVHF